MTDITEISVVIVLGAIIIASMILKNATMPLVAVGILGGYIGTRPKNSIQSSSLATLKSIKK
jgi:hypothetical protein